MMKKYSYSELKDILKEQFYYLLDRCVIDESVPKIDNVFKSIKINNVYRPHILFEDLLDYLDLQLGKLIFTCNINGYNISIHENDERMFFLSNINEFGNGHIILNIDKLKLLDLSFEDFKLNGRSFINDEYKRDKRFYTYSQGNLKIVHSTSIYKHYTYEYRLHFYEGKLSGGFKLYRYLYKSGEVFKTKLIERVKYIDGTLKSRLVI